MAKLIQFFLVLLMVSATGTQSSAAGLKSCAQFLSDALIAPLLVTVDTAVWGLGTVFSRPDKARLAKMRLRRSALLLAPYLAFAYSIDATAAKFTITKVDDFNHTVFANQTLAAGAKVLFIAGIEPSPVAINAERNLHETFAGAAIDVRGYITKNSFEH